MLIYTDLLYQDNGVQLTHDVIIDISLGSLPASICVFSFVYPAHVLCPILNGYFVKAILREFGQLTKLTVF